MLSSVCATCTVHTVLVLEFYSLRLSLIHSNDSDMHAACAYGVRVTVLVHLELAVESTKVPRDSILTTEK